nr:FLYWCH-type zinc finger-containing protein [Ipomoea batatas]
MEEPETPTVFSGAAAMSQETAMFSDDIDSSCSTPYVSAPSSPGRGQPHCGFYYSAPASPMHFVLSTTSLISGASVHSEASAAAAAANSSFEFDFSSRLAGEGDACAGSMSSADELFFNGQIRPMKLSTHLQRPQVLAPLLDLDESEEADMDRSEEQACRGRDLKFRDRSLRRRTRSMSPLRTASFQWHEDFEDNGERKPSNEKKEKCIEGEVNKGHEDEANETTPCNSGSSSRSSSVGRSSKRWVFLKEFLYRSKSEGRNNPHKFWGALSFSPVKEKKTPPSAAAADAPATSGGASDVKKPKAASSKEARKKPVNGNSAGTGKRRVPPSPHELHYTANRAQAEEMRKKTFLPYRQGLLGCLGFSSKSYGAMNGLARALNPVSSR